MLAQSIGMRSLSICSVARLINWDALAQLLNQSIAIRSIAYQLRYR
jgi:hypothetical protein